MVMPLVFTGAPPCLGLLMCKLVCIPLLLAPSNPPVSLPLYTPPLPSFLSLALSLSRSLARFFARLPSSSAHGNPFSLVARNTPLLPPPLLRPPPNTPLIAYLSVACSSSNQDFTFEDDIVEFGEQDPANFREWAAEILATQVAIRMRFGFLSIFQDKTFEKDFKAWEVDESGWWNLGNSRSSQLTLFATTALRNSRSSQLPISATAGPTAQLPWN